MNQEAIRDFGAAEFPEADIVIGSQEAGSPEISWGDTFFFHAKDESGSNYRFPFATLVTKDYGDFDKASHLDRPDVFRLNIGLSRETFRSLFGAETNEAGYDFTALDKLMPHPVYAPQFFACILNPSDATFQTTIRPLLKE